MNDSEGEPLNRLSPEGLREVEISRANPGADIDYDEMLT
jgi:hypothetical protein